MIDCNFSTAAKVRCVLQFIVGVNSDQKKKMILASPVQLSYLLYYYKIFSNIWSKAQSCLRELEKMLSYSKSIGAVLPDDTIIISFSSRLIICIRRN